MPSEKAMDDQMPVETGLIEVLNRFGQVQHRIPWRGQALRVGRAYDNDIIVEDPFVCPHHLELRPSNHGVEAIDLDSVNGIYASKSRSRQSAVSLSSGQDIRFGHSRLRFRANDFQVAPSIKDIAAHGLLRQFKHPFAVMVFLLMALLTTLMDAALGQVEPLNFNIMVASVIVPLVGLLLWVGFWALINRASLQRWNFLAHFGISGFFIALWFVVFHGLALLSFGLGWDSGHEWLERGMRWLVFALMIYCHLRFATHGKRVVQFASAFLLVGAVLSWGALDTIRSAKEFSSLPKVNTMIKPPVFQIKPGVSLEEFFDAAEKLTLDKAE